MSGLIASDSWSVTGPARPATNSSASRVLPTPAVPTITSPWPSDQSRVNSARSLPVNGHAPIQFPSCGTSWNTFPAFAVANHDYQPKYRTFKGWKTSTVGITSYDELPQQAKDYVRFIEDETGAKASIISTGPRREETIVRG